jgi:hypothetical protein
MMHGMRRFIGAVMLIGAMLASARAGAQQVIVDGDMWLTSAPEVKKAFLVGAANMIALERAYAEKNGTPQPAVGAMARKAIEHMTLDQIIDRITNWYEENPDRHEMPVMGVIWFDLIKPAASGQ